MLFCCCAAGAALPAGLPDVELSDIDHKSSKLAAGFCCCCCCCGAAPVNPDEVVGARPGGGVGAITGWFGTRGAPPIMEGGGEAIMGRIMPAFCIAFCGGRAAATGAPEESMLKRLLLAGCAGGGVNDWAARG